MRYSILGFKQEDIVNYKIDMSDVLLLDYIYTACASPSMKKTHDENEQPHVWLQHKKVLEDLPVLGFGEDMLKKRLHKLSERGLISTIFKSDEVRGKRAYYTITEKCENMRYTNQVENITLNQELDNDQVENITLSHVRPSVKNYPSDNKLISNNKLNNTFTNVKVEQPSVTPKTSHDNSSKLPKRIPLIKPNIVRESINNSSNIDSSKENKKENESILNKGVVSPIKKKNLYEKCIDKIYEFTDDAEIRERLIEYLGVRLERKDIEFGSKGFEGMLKRLKRTSSDKQEQLAIIQQAIDRNYPTFYPLSKHTKQNKDVFSEYGKVKSIHKDEEIVNVSF